ncbi:MATE family efflux transporter [Pseudoflavonifractor phocaeensis]|uniref:MATE family efflux transporter n=1 Tax=Pseudoflavonifractor phocaeensis TaxID=1870988 RepID=UPI001957AE2C|nr:MATE family efflux transporter [Pseudoflavonifractor phocaeensis]MBM6886317.1 MATE family efflux transporter [Pseudoflavonifractor phocaeensis]
MARNIIHMAVPMTVAQLINILYNVVDRMYLGRLPGHLALTGLGLCLPIISILMGFANLCGMGGAPLCSIHRGRGETDEAERIMGNSFTLLLLFGLSLTGLCLAFRHPILYLFGASDLTFPYANDYLTIYILGTVFVMVGLGMNPFINSQGFSRMGMMTVTVGAVVNIVLDPVFIFGMGMGVRGAALATVISQGCSAVWVLRFLTGRRAILRLRLSALRLHAGRVKRILSLGSSGFAMSMTNSLVQVLCNATLQAWGGELYVGVMTVINSIREVISMPVQGITNGCQPVLGYNYGAGEYRRVRQGIRFTTALTMAYSLVVWLLVLLFPEFLIRIFNNEPDLIAAGIPAFRIYFATFFCMSFQFIGQSVFVGLGRSRQAVFFSLLRKAFIVAPLTLLLPALGLGVDGVFLAEPISNVVGGLACLLTMYAVVYRPLGKMKS